MRTLLVILYLNYYVLGQEIAKQKCQEYAQAVYQKEQTLSDSSEENTTRAPLSTCALFVNPLIVGGEAARSKEFPHMAVIGFGQTETSELEWLCGGSLISEKHVLTAAHCTISVRGPPQKVRLGITNINEQHDYLQEKVLETFLNHPDYKKPKKYNDIAILILQTPVEFTAFVRPACLNFENEISVTKAQASGFGKRNYDDDETSETLFKVELDIIPVDTCENYTKYRQFEMPNGIIDTMLCAGVLSGGKDTCQGDSGGPLQVILEEPFCMYSIIGITSFGRYCGMKNSPGIYTNVFKYLPWIEEVVWS